MTNSAAKTTQRVMRSIRTNEGTEFIVNRSMPQEQLPHLDPFVLLDELGPEIPPGYVEGFGKHPHAGIEVVTYMIDGQMHAGEPNADGDILMNPNDVGYGAFGGGAVHYERPIADVLQNGGTCHGVQLWLALPKKDKYCDPHDGAARADELPVWESDDGKTSARIMLGAAFGLTSPMKTFNTVNYLHIRLEPGGSISVPSPTEYNSFLFMIDGQARLADGKTVKDQQLAMFNQDGDHVRIECARDAAGRAELLLLSGKPNDEPICRAAVFVMNSWDEIQQCFEKYGDMMEKIHEQHL